MIVFHSYLIDGVHTAITEVDFSNLFEYENFIFFFIVVSFEYFDLFNTVI